MTFDNDYAYIGVFIGFLERIVDIFIKLLNAIRAPAAPAEPQTTTESTTAAPTV